MGDPEVAANCSVVTYVDAAQDGGVGIDHHVVAEDGVTGDALDERTVGLLREVLGTKGYAMVESAVAPMTTPVPWSMANEGPMVAPGWMSMPVSLWASSVIIRGMSGTSSW